MNKYPEKVKLAVVNRYLNGVPISKISHDTNISRTTVMLGLNNTILSLIKEKHLIFVIYIIYSKNATDCKKSSRYLSVHPTAYRTIIKKIRSN